LFFGVVLIWFVLQNSVVNDELTAAQTDLHDVYDKVMSAHQKRLAASGHAAAKNGLFSFCSFFL
jgi:hypothetical protein